jgi:uncharacterized cupredoxin-like copper-binding protein
LKTRPRAPPAAEPLRADKRLCHLSSVGMSAPTWHRITLLALLVGSTSCNVGPREASLELTVVRRAAKDGHGSTIDYDKREVYVPAGSQVVLTLRNSITDPILAHNFVLVQPGTVEEVAAAAAAQPPGSDPGRLPGQLSVLASSPLAGPGQSVTFRFIAPPAGYYEFLCTAAGDAPARLRGKFVVQ